MSRHVRPLLIQHDLVGGQRRPQLVVHQLVASQAESERLSAEDSTHLFKPLPPALAKAYQIADIPYVFTEQCVFFKKRGSHGVDLWPIMSDEFVHIVDRSFKTHPRLASCINPSQQV